MNAQIMSNPTSKKVKKQGFFARLLTKKSVSAPQQVKNQERQLYDSVPVKKTKAATHARNKHRSAILITAVPALEAIWLVVKIMAVGVFGTLAWHVTADIIKNAATIFGKINAGLLFLVAIATAIVVFTVFWYYKQKKKYTKKPYEKRRTKYSALFENLHIVFGLASFGIIFVVPYVGVFVYETISRVITELLPVAEMVLNLPVVITLVVIFAAKAAYGWYKVQVVKWKKIAERDAQQR